MGNLQSLKNKFDNAQRALLQILFSSEDTNMAYVQVALDRMNQAFQALLIEAMAAEQQSPQVQELLCAYAINQGDDWNGSCWQVAFVDGNLVPEQERLSVADFTRQMINSGWKTTSLPMGTDVVHAPEGVDVIPLYFCRENSPQQWNFDRPQTRKSILNSN